MDSLDLAIDMGSYGALCKAVSELHSSAEVVLVISKGKLAASHIKSGGPAPDEDEFRLSLPFPRPLPRAKLLPRR